MADDVRVGDLQVVEQRERVNDRFAATSATTTNAVATTAIANNPTAWAHL